MSALFDSVTRAVLRHLDPEKAHSIALRCVRLGFIGKIEAASDDPVLRVSAFGLKFGNPIGLAAGFDKDAAAIGGLSRLGFGFIETGTVTLRPQSGNEQPRLFRLEEDAAIINRMGFNNSGLAPYVQRLSVGRSNPVIVGANVGINSDDSDPERDFPELVRAISGHVNYVVINLSSPNTAGLRALQAAERLKAILKAISACAGHSVRLLVKIAPDLSGDEIEAIVEICAEREVSGLMVSNTTIDRPSTLRSPRRSEAGGLSGAPLFVRSTAVLARAYRLSRGRLILVGVGGIRTGADAFTKIQAGAHLVQVYTAFAYEGPALLPRLKRELAGLLHAGGFSCVEDAVGTGADRLSRLSEPV